jgi:hypothetical protein
VPCAERSADDSLLDVSDAGREVVDDEESLTGRQERYAVETTTRGEGK